MERQLISTRVQYQSLQKQHAFTKQQLQHMKVHSPLHTSALCLPRPPPPPPPNMMLISVVQVQVATLMQLQGSRTDSAQMERLQSMLCEKNSEIQNLMSKLQRLERVEVRGSSPTELNYSTPRRHLVTCSAVSSGGSEGSAR